MKAVNSGAMEAGVPSIGLKEALLQGEQGVGDDLDQEDLGFGV
jgi:predicted Rossmann-fold nucleotide-binding protein